MSKRRRSVWAPLTPREAQRDELILADLLALGPASAGLMVDTPALIFSGMLRACRMFNIDRNPERAAVDAFEIWQGYEGTTQPFLLLETTRSRSNFAIGQAYRLVVT